VSDAEEAKEAEGALPEPNFLMLVSNFATQAMIELGEIKNPITNKKELAADRAKFTIDMLQVIRDKTYGNLAADEQKFLDAALYELRLKYVGLFKK
jgi:Domain of unknown function (DUF1844)